MGEIVGSLNQTYRETTDDNIAFEVKAILDEELDRQCSFNVEVSGNLTGMKIRYIINSLGNQYEPINKLVYESEILENNTRVNFNERLIPINELATDEHLEDNIVEIVFKDVLHSDELGKFTCNIIKLFEKENFIDLKGNKKAKITCVRKNFHSLLDYLETGLHLSTTLFIDFSESNDIHSSENNENNETFFEKLMNHFINILLPFNEDQFFQIYGFGFELKDIFSNYDPNTSYMYPINKKIDSPSITKDEIKKYYDGFLSSINFGQNKTDLSLIIKKMNNKIKEDIDNYDISEYNVLLLFTNNDIFDEQEFANDLIVSSSLPMSVVIVGLGKTSFTKLQKIDNNFLSLINSEGNSPKRKCIKFVEYKNTKNIQRTVRNSLINVPNEMLEYLSINNIEPH